MGVITVITCIHPQQAKDLVNGGDGGVQDAAPQQPALELHGGRGHGGRQRPRQAPPSHDRSSHQVLRTHFVNIFRLKKIFLPQNPKKNPFLIFRPY